MAKVKYLAARLARAVRIVLHDPAVARSAKATVVIISARAVIALGGSVETVKIVKNLLVSLGLA